MDKNDVKTFADLVIFCKIRAKRSAKRNDPIAWAYWEEAAQWARTMKALPSADWQAKVYAYMGQVMSLRNEDPSLAARFYSRAKWLRILSINNGWKKCVAPLSLTWLHDLMA